MTAAASASTCFRSVSPDGQTLTMAHHNDPLAGQIAVFARGADTDEKRFG